MNRYTWVTRRYTTIDSRYETTSDCVVSETRRAS